MKKVKNRLQTPGLGGWREGGEIEVTRTHMAKNIYINKLTEYTEYGICECFSFDETPLSCQEHHRSCHEVTGGGGGGGEGVKKATGGKQTTTTTKEEKPNDSENLQVPTEANERNIWWGD